MAAPEPQSGPLAAGEHRTAPYPHLPVRESRMPDDAATCLVLDAELNGWWAGLSPAQRMHVYLVLQGVQTP